MARHARTKAAGMAFHIIHRGNNRCACFVDRSDRVFYLGLMSELADVEQCSIHAYVLMTNHVHLLVTSHAADGMSRFMKRVAQRHAMRINRRWHRTGTLWDGRFRSSIIDTERYLLTCQRYIEMNPVRAGMVPHPRDHPWSSYAAHAEGEASLILQPHPAYLSLGTGETERHAAYRRLFDIPIVDEQLARIRDAVNSGLPLGDKDFLDRLGAGFGFRVAKSVGGRPGKPRKPLRARGRPRSTAGRASKIG
jgi:putative transposase